MENNAKLIAIARTAVRRGPMEEIGTAAVTIEAGIAGDARGAKRRQISVLFRQDWEAACRAVPLAAPLPWTVRRANLLLDGANPRTLGGTIVIGDMVLEVICQTEPCELMEKAQPGLLAAMTPDWRGGVCCKVVKGGTIARGDLAAIG